MPNIIAPTVPAPNTRFAIVVARWNETITRKLLDGAIATLKEQGVADDVIDVAWVPGSMEIPLVAQRFAVSGSLRRRHLSRRRHSRRNNTRSAHQPRR